MSEPHNLFKEKELEYLNNIDFLITKKEIIEKLRILFKETEYHLNQKIYPVRKNFPKEVLIKSGKLSKGENYRSLPFLILDFPRMFKSNNVFAFRTMFWWGNFFSCTLHLQGTILDHYRPVLEKSLKDLYHNKIYISVADNPWEYHYQQSNYRLTDELSEGRIAEIIKEKPFLKLSKYINVMDYDKLPEFSSNTLSLFLKILNIYS